MAEEQRISIDIVSDVVCPWCYVGQKRLEEAMALAPEIGVDLRWRPYQLDPTIPPEGLDRDSYMKAKFGEDGRLEEMQVRLEELGRDAGIIFHFADITRSPNTLDAHRLIRWAASADGTDVQDAVVKRLFQLYFEEGRDVGDRAVLIAAARECGMDATLVETLLGAGADLDEVQAEIETARRMGVTGVPCFLFENRYAVIGAQDAETLADAIRQIAAAKARGELDENAS
ncbi:MAG: DsbA family oxidoreductase [Rhizobiaceae bacterium]